MTPWQVITVVLVAYAVTIALFILMMGLAWLAEQWWRWAK